MSVNNNTVFGVCYSVQNGEFKQNGEANTYDLDGFTERQSDTGMYYVINEGTESEMRIYRQVAPINLSKAGDTVLDFSLFDSTSPGSVEMVSISTSPGVLFDLEPSSQAPAPITVESTAVKVKKASKVSKVKRAVKSVTTNITHRLVNTFVPLSFLNHPTLDATVRRNDIGQPIRFGVPCSVENAEKETRAARRYTLSENLATLEHLVSHTFSRKGLEEFFALKKHAKLDEDGHVEQTGQFTAEEKENLRKEMVAKLFEKAPEKGLKAIQDTVSQMIETAKNEDLSAEDLTSLKEMLNKRSFEIISGLSDGSMVEVTDEQITENFEKMGPLKKMVFAPINTVRQAWNLVSYVQQATLGLIQTPFSVLGFENTAPEKLVTAVVGTVLLASKAILVPVALAVVVAAKALKLTLKGLFAAASFFLKNTIGRPLGMVADKTQEGRNKAVDAKILRNHDHKIRLMMKRVKNSPGSEWHLQRLKTMREAIKQRTVELGVVLKREKIGKNISPHVEDKQNTFDIKKDLPPANPENFVAYIIALENEFNSFVDGGYPEEVRAKYRSGVAGRLTETVAERATRKALRAQEKKEAQARKQAAKDAKAAEKRLKAEEKARLKALEADKPGVFSRIKNRLPRLPGFGSKGSEFNLGGYDEI